MISIRNNNTNVGKGMLHHDPKVFNKWPRRSMVYTQTSGDDLLLMLIFSFIFYNPLGRYYSVYPPYIHLICAMHHMQDLWNLP